MEKKLIPIILVIITLSLFSCRKRIEQTGSLSGYIKLYGHLDTNDFETIFFKDFSYTYGHEGIKIKLIKNKREEYETTTDIDGYFRIDNITSGTYKVIIEKDGYWPYVIDDYVITGGGNQWLKNTEFHYYDLDFILLWPKRPQVNKNVEAYVKNDSLVLFADIDLYTEPGYNCTFLLSTKKDLDQKSALDYYSVYGWAPERKYSLDLLRHYFIFDKGDTIYWKAYFFSVKVIYYYYSETLYENYNFISQPLPDVDQVMNDSNYFEFYGLPETAVKSGFFVIPNTFESKLPPGVAFPEDKILSNEREWDF